MKRNSSFITSLIRIFTILCLLATVTPTVIAAPDAFVILASDGLYFAKIFGTAGNTSSGGYCGTSAICSGPPPTTFRWRATTTSTSSQTGYKWDYTDTGATTTFKVFVPDTNATNYTGYDVSYGSSSQIRCYIDQSAYVNQLVTCGSTQYNVRYVTATNFGSSSSTKTAWDEITLSW